MLPDLWTAQTDAPPTRSLEIASRFPQHPQPKPLGAFPTDLNGTEELQILCPPPGVAGFQTFFTGRVWTFGDTGSEFGCASMLEIALRSWGPDVNIGANGGIRTRTSRLGRPAGDRYPTFALVRPTSIEPVPPRWRRGMHPPHPGRTWTGVVHRPIDISSVVKDPALASWWAARDSNPMTPRGGDGVTARQRTIRSYRPFGDSARI